MADWNRSMGQPRHGPEVTVKARTRAELAAMNKSKQVMSERVFTAEGSHPFPTRRNVAILFKSADVQTVHYRNFRLCQDFVRRKAPPVFAISAQGAQSKRPAKLDSLPVFSFAV